jgi:hypothetical protein
MTSKLGLVLAVVAAAGCRESRRDDRPTEPTRQFVSTHYSDTSTQSVSRTKKTVRGYVASSEGDTVRYVAAVTKEALVDWVDLIVQGGPSHREPDQKMRVIMPKETLPLMGDAVGFLEQILRRARVVGGDNVRIPIMYVGAHAELGVIVVRKAGADSVLLLGSDGDERAAVRLGVDSLGHITGGATPLSSSKLWQAEDQ